MSLPGVTQACRDCRGDQNVGLVQAEAGAVVGGADVGGDVLPRLAAFGADQQPVVGVENAIAAVAIGSHRRGHHLASAGPASTSYDPVFLVLTLLALMLLSNFRYLGLPAATASRTFDTAE